MNIPNLISLFRLPLALLLFIPSVPLRLALLAIAMLTDGLDGYIARRYNMQTRLGAILDPLTDKFFVLVALFIFYKDPQPGNSIEPWMIAAFFSRDIALFLFTIRAFFLGPFLTHPVKSIWPGKATTALQFAVLALLVAGITVPQSVWILFFLLGGAFLIELLRKNTQKLPE